MRFEGKGFRPRGHDCLNTCLQFNDPDRGLLIEIGSLDIENMGPASETICLIFVIERV